MLHRSLRALSSFAQGWLLAASLATAAQAGTLATAWKIGPATEGPLPAVTTDPAGNTYGFTAKVLTKTTPAGVASTLALAAAGPGAEFTFTDLAVDARGNVYAAETNQGRDASAAPGELILEVTAAGVTTTIPVAVSAPAAVARPYCQLAVDGSGDVFTIAPDYSVREVLPDGQVLLLAPQAAFNHLDGQTGYPEDLSLAAGGVVTTGSIAAAHYTGAIKIYAVHPTLPAESASLPGDPESRVRAAAASPGGAASRISPAATATSTALSSAPGGRRFVLADVEAGNGILKRELVVSGEGPSRVLLRAAGPALAELGVEGALAQPVLSLYNAAGDLVARNSGWDGGEDAGVLAEAAAAAGTFAFAPGSADCALLLDLPAGRYAAEVTGADGTAGNVLVEAYLVP